MGLEIAAAGSLLFAGSSFGTLTIAGVSAAQVGSLLLTVALSGAQFAMAALTKPRRPPGVDQSVKQNVRQADVPQRRCYGTTRTGGAIFFYEAIKPYLYVGYAYNAGPIDSIVSWRLNGKNYSVDTAGNALDAPFRRAADGFVFVQHSIRYGASDQAIDPILAADFPALPSTFRQRGSATVVFKAHYGGNRDEHDSIYGSGGQFEPLLTIRGAKVYDPRDPAQDRDNSSTWKWSDTASLIIADYIRDPIFGRVPPDRIDWDSVAASATRDEEPVALASGGWQKRYTINGVVDTSQRPEEVIRSMLTANRGRVVMTGGLMRIISGGVPDPVMTIHDGLVIGPVEARSATARANLINRVKTEFIAPDREWTTANGPVYDREDLQDEDGAIYEQSITLPFTDTHQRAQRLAKAFLLDARYGRFVTVQCTNEAILLEAGDIVQIDLTWLPSATGLYTVEKAEMLEGFNGVALSLSEYSSDIENGWVPAADEQPFDISPTEI